MVIERTSKKQQKQLKVSFGSWSDLQIENAIVN